MITECLLYTWETGVQRGQKLTSRGIEMASLTRRHRVFRGDVCHSETTVEGDSEHDRRVQHSEEKMAREGLREMTHR